MTSFMMGTTSSITMQSLGKIARRAPEQVRKHGVCMFTKVTFTHRPKIRFFVSQERLVAPIHVKLGRADGHVRPLGSAKFHHNRHRGVGMRPRNFQKIPLFGKERSEATQRSVARSDDSFDQFLKFLGAFIRLTILHQRFEFHVIRITSYGVIGVIAEKPRVGKLGQIYPCTLQEKLCVGSKNE